jgi:hypothetical protein
MYPDRDPLGPDLTPWKYEGALRRDHEPDRAVLLTWLATGALVTGAASFLLVCLAPVGLVLALTLESLARRDLELMRQGRMDPVGYDATARVRAAAQPAFVLSVGAMAAWVVFACVLWGMIGALAH